MRKFPQIAGTLRKGGRTEKIRKRQTHVIRKLKTLLRGTIVNRIYGIHKNRYIQTFLLTIFGPTSINYGPP